MKTSPLIREPADIYHRQSDKFLSSSALRRFRSSPYEYRCFRDFLIPREESHAFDFGEEFHCLALEPARFEREYEVCDPPFNERTRKPFGKNTKAYREWKSQQLRKPISTADYGKQCSMLSSLQTHPIAGSLLREGTPEAVVRTELYGRQCQIRMDWYRPGQLIDLKTTKGLTEFAESVVRFGYVHQLAFYRDVGRQAELEINDCQIIAVEKTEPFRCGVFQPTEDAIRRASEENQLAITELLECERSNHWPTRYEDVVSLELENER